MSKVALQLQVLADEAFLPQACKQPKIRPFSFPIHYSLNFEKPQMMHHSRIRQRYFPRYGWCIRPSFFESIQYLGSSFKPGFHVSNPLQVSVWVKSFLDVVHQETMCCLRWKALVFKVPPYREYFVAQTKLDKYYCRFSIWGDIFSNVQKVNKNVLREIWKTKLFWFVVIEHGCYLAFYQSNPLSVILG